MNALPDMTFMVRSMLAGGKHTLFQEMNIAQQTAEDSVMSALHVKQTSTGQSHAMSLSVVRTFTSYL